MFTRKLRRLLQNAFIQPRSTIRRRRGLQSRTPEQLESRCLLAITVLDTSFASIPGNVSLVGSASHRSANADVLLTQELTNRTGSIVVSNHGYKATSFTADANIYLGGDASGGDGLSLGYGSLSGGAFGGRGENDDGVWLYVDTYEGNSSNGSIGLYVNGALRVEHGFSGTSRALLAPDGRRLLRLQVYPNGSGTRFWYTHPAFGLSPGSGYFFDLGAGQWNPQSSWRFGVGAHTGAAADNQVVDYLTIVDTSNHAPTNIGLSSNGVSENSSGATIGTLSSTDPDELNTFSYSLVSGAGDNASFQIVGTSLRTAVGLNYEAGSTRSVVIRTTDQGGLTFDKTFTINVSNVNETPTDITLSNSVIAENQSNATIGTFSTADPDAGNSFTYILVGGAGSTDNARFQISGNSLRTVEGLNYEESSTRSVRIRSTDQGGLPVEKSFIINVGNVNETPLDVGLSSSTIAENLPGASIGTLSTVDPDAGNTFTYSLVAGTGSTDNGSFQIVSNTLRTAAGLDYEAGSTRSVRIRSTDQGGLLVEKSFIINVTDINEAPTSISLSPGVIHENLLPGDSLGSLMTIDPDAGNSHNYLLVAGPGDEDNSKFEVVTNTLRTAAGFDVTAQSSFHFRVRSTDQDGLFFEQSFSKSVAHFPTGINLSASTIAENQPSGTAVGTLTTSDLEGGAFSYALVSGVGATDNGRFSIVNDILQSAESFNFESQATHSIRLRTMDSTGLSFVRVLTISVTDVNEAPFSLNVGQSTVAENQPVGTLVDSFTTVDPDAGNTFTYALVSGPGDTDNASFSINGGTLITAATFDREARAAYSIRVRVTDQGALSYETPLDITISNVNEAPTNVFLSQNTVAENRPASSTVGTLSTIDPDSGNLFVYNLVSGFGSDDNSSFFIDGDGILKTLIAFDYEVKNSYSIRVRSTDQGSLFTERTFTVDITDVVDETPPAVSTASFVTSGTLASGATSLTVTFSEAVVGGNLTSNYELRRAGADGLLGNGDDPTMTISSVNVSGNTATLGFASLTEDVYRLTAKDTITDVTGNALDGDANGTTGGNWRKDVVVGALSTILTSPTPNAFPFDVEFGGIGTGQLVQGPSGAFDGVGRLNVGGSSFSSSATFSQVTEVASSPGGSLNESFTDIAGLTTTMTLERESLVQLRAALSLSSTDNANWSGGVRFTVNGTPETVAATFANPYVLPMLSGTTSSNTDSFSMPGWRTTFISGEDHTVSGTTNFVSGSGSHVISGTTDFGGSHDHDINSFSFSSDSHNHTWSLSPTASNRSVAVDAEDWVVLPAGTYTFRAQSQSTGSVQFNATQSMSAIAIAKRPTTSVNELSVNSSSIVPSAFADISGLTTTVTLAEESMVHLDARLHVASLDNSNWSGAARFTINGTAESTAGVFANPYTLGTSSFSASLAQIVIDPPSIGTSSNGSHTHTFSGSTSFNANAGHSHSVLTGTTSSDGLHAHSVDYPTTGSSGHSHAAIVSSTSASRSTSADAEEWIVLPAGTYTFNVQAQTSGIVQLNGDQQFTVATIAKVPNTSVSSSTATSSVAVPTTFTDVAGLGKTFTLTESSFVQIDARLRLSSNSNVNWSGATRFTINGVAEAEVATFANPYVLPFLSGTSSLVSVLVDPPSVSTLTSGSHSHNWGGSTTSGDHSHTASGTTSSSGSHSHTVNIPSFNSSSHSHSVSVSSTNSARNSKVEAEDWVLLPAGTYTLNVQAQASTGVQFSGEQGLTIVVLPVSAPISNDNNQTLLSSAAVLAGLLISREVTVPSTGAQDFARTVDIFTNSSGSPITTTVSVVGNLGSDASTTVFATSDGDLIVEPTDRWFGTDDVDGTGTPAIIHLLHGPLGLRPTSVNVIEDNVEWTYDLTVPAGETKRLASFTVLGTTRAQAIAAANTLVTNSGFGGEAAAFLTSVELASLVNFEQNVAPSDIAISANSIAENQPSATSVGTFTTTDANSQDTQTYALVSGTGSTDNASFTIDGNTLRTAASFNFEAQNSYSIRVRTTDLGGLAFDKVFTITVTDVQEDLTPPVSAVLPLPLNATSLLIPIPVSGTDPNGPVGSTTSGVKEFDLYVAQDSGPFVKFATVPFSDPGTFFNATSNHTYFFRSIGRDNAGNEEIKATNYADAFIRVADLDKPITQVTSASANATGAFTLAISGSEVGGSQLAAFDLYVSIDNAAAVLIGSVSGGTPTGGVYSATATYQGLADGILHTYRFYSRGRDTAGNVEDAPAIGDVTTTQTFSAPPALEATGIDVQGGMRQRSYITNVDLLFNTATGVGGLTAANRTKVERFGLSATSVTPGTGIDVPIGSFGLNGSKLTVNFGSALSNDGFYRIRADVNGDGDYDDAGEMFEFYRLLGDANGDAIVDVLDTAVVDSLFGRVGTSLDGDLNGDGIVNTADKSFTLRSYRGRKLSDLLKPLLDD